MKPQEVKIKIARIKQSTLERKILIKAHEKYRDEKNFSERMNKQEEIVAEAKKVMALIQQEYDDAPSKIEEIKRHIRFDDRRLIELNNYEKIELLKKTANEIRNLSIGDEHGKEHNHTQARGQNRNS